VVAIIIIWCRVVWHMFPKLAGAIPESGLLLVLGLAVGGVMYGGGLLLNLPEEINNDVFFLIIIPLILFPDAYFLDTGSVSFFFFFFSFL
jgi:hypothetical protein